MYSLRNKFLSKNFLGQLGHKHDVHTNKHDVRIAESFHAQVLVFCWPTCTEILH